MVPVTIESTSKYGESLYLGINQGQGYLDYKGSGWFLILSESTKDAFAVLQKTIIDFIVAARDNIGSRINSDTSFFKSAYYSHNPSTCLGLDS